jgi:Protein of unknown function (DUF3570)
MTRRRLLGSAVVSVLVLGAGEREASADGASSVSWQTNGDTSVYVDSDAVSAITPSLSAKAEDPLAGWTANGSYLVDIISAASVDIVSTASPHWQEVRHAANVGFKYEPGTMGGGANASVSSEPDFISVTGGLTGSFDFERKNVTLDVGASYGHDRAGRSGTPFSVYALDLDRYSLAASLEIVLDRATTFTPAFELALEFGRQEKPYRYLPLFSASVAPTVPVGASGDLVNSLREPGRVAENLPDNRQRYAASGRLAHRFSGSTLILNDRLYADSWGLVSTTTDMRWVLDVGRRFFLWPHFRANLQRGVNFWQRAYVGQTANGSVDVPVYRAGDRELGPLYSIGFGPGARFDLGSSDPETWSLVIQAEGTYTRFENALFIDHRWAWFGGVGLERRFE